MISFDPGLERGERGFHAGTVQIHFPPSLLVDSSHFFVLRILYRGGAVQGERSLRL